MLVQKNSKLVELEKNKVGGVKEVIICNYAEIKDVYRDHETGYLHANLRFDNIYGEKAYKIIPLADLNAKGLSDLEKIGFDLPKGKKVHILVDYLKQQVRDREPKNRHEIVGYGQKDKKVFKCVDHIGDQLSTYVGHIDVYPKGNREEYLNFILEYVLPYPKLAIMIATSLAAPLLNRICEFVLVESVIANICGKSSTGKTTASMLGISLFGNPSPESVNSCTFTFGNTMNYIHEVIGQYFNGVPCTIDEMGASELLGKQFTEYVYRLANGTTRGRLDRDYKPTKVYSYKTVIFMNGEFRLKDKIDSSAIGANIRILTFDDVQFFNDAQHCEYVKQFVSNCYGHLGYDFVDYIDTIDSSTLKEIYDDCRNELEVAIAKDVGSKLSSRIASKYAPITCALTLFLNMIDKIDDYPLYHEAQDFLAKMITAHAAEYNNEADLIMGIVQYLNDNPNEFQKLGGVAKDSSDLICIEQKDEIVFKKEGFKSLLEQANLMDLKEALKFFKAKEILVVNKDGDRNTFYAKRAVFGDKNERTVVFNKKKFKALLTETEDHINQKIADFEDDSNS